MGFPSEDRDGSREQDPRRVATVAMTAEELERFENVGRGRVHGCRRKQRQPLREFSPDTQDARALLPSAHRHGAGRRRHGTGDRERVHLLRDGLLRLRGNTQPARQGEEGSPAPARGPTLPDSEEAT